MYLADIIIIFKIFIDSKAFESGQKRNEMLKYAYKNPKQIQL